jgi:hypothetical protein
MTNRDVFDTGYYWYKWLSESPDSTLALIELRTMAQPVDAIPEESYVWVRLGDAADYESYDSPSDAGEVLGERLWEYELERSDLLYSPDSFALTIPDLFDGMNYISLYWGDQAAEPIGALTDTEFNMFVNSALESVREVMEKETGRA